MISHPLTVGGLAIFLISWLISAYFLIRLLRCRSSNRDLREFTDIFNRKGLSEIGVKYRLRVFQFSLLGVVGFVMSVVGIALK